VLFWLATGRTIGELGMCLTCMIKAIEGGADPAALGFTSTMPDDAPQGAVVSDFTALLSSRTWTASTSYRQGAFVTYSFDLAPQSHLGGTYSAAALASFQPFTEDQKTLARQALGMWSASTGLVFLEVPSGQGQITFNSIEFDLVPSTFAGFGYYPGFTFSQTSPSGPSLATAVSALAGDTFYDIGRVSLGLLLHEIGHALGFKHTFEGTNTLSTALDNTSNSVMSYTGGLRQQLGYLDIQAAQHVYGVTDGGHLAWWNWDPTTLMLTQAGTAGADWIIGTTINDTVLGEAGDDSISVFDGANIVYGGAGNDTINAGKDNDFIDGGDGVDSINAWAGNNTVIGGTGNDMISAGSGDDYVDGGDGDDTINTGDGKDTVLGGAGDDTITAWAGSKTVYGGAGADRITTGAGFDLIYAGTEADIVWSGSGNDTVDGEAGDDDLYGQDGDDILFGGDGLDTLWGGSGNDTLSGGAGADKLFGDTGNDILDGGTGVDEMWGGDGDDTYYVDAVGEWVSDTSGYDRVFTTASILSALAGIEEIAVIGAGTAALTLAGNSLSNVITGGNGDDRIIGGGGSDKVDGGAGTDTFVLPGTFASYTIARGATGTTALLSGADGLHTVENVEAFEFAGGVIRSFASLPVAGGPTAGNDILVGGAGNDTIDGLGGNDVMDGGAGNDTLTGGPGADRLSGGDGDDTLIFDAADLEVKGGEGFDTARSTDGPKPSFNLAANGIERLVWTETGGVRGTTTLSDSNTTATTVREDLANTAAFTSETVIARYGAFGYYAIVNDNGSATYYDVDELAESTLSFSFLSYAAGNVFDYAIYGYDDGRRVLYDVDQAGVGSLAYSTSVYTQFWTLDYSYSAYDNGTATFILNDKDGSQSWSQIVTAYAVNGAVAYSYVQYDNGQIAYF
jgi:Ca2+-binding RTX toxin-like protein